MSDWVPFIAVFGLGCLVMVPAPGIEGLVIGCVCALLIAVDAALLALVRLASQLLALAARMKARVRQPGREVHVGSGIGRKLPRRQ